MKKYIGFKLQLVTLSVLLIFILISFTKWNANQTIENFKFLNVPVLAFWVALGLLMFGNFMTYQIISKNKDAVTLANTDQGSSLYIFMSDFLKLSEDQMRRVRNVYLITLTIWTNITLIGAMFIMFYADSSNIEQWGIIFIGIFATSGGLIIIFDLLGLLGLYAWIKNMLKKER